MTLVDRFEKALSWIDKYSTPIKGVAISSKDRTCYPEVSGYYIPTLISWNEKDRAQTYGSWLRGIQNADGSWSDPSGSCKCVFDTGQIVKGLLALYELDGAEQWKPAIISACKWIVTHIDDAGNMRVPDINVWGNSIPNGILLYSLQAVKRAGELLDREDWLRKVDCAINTFLADENLTKFSHLSHFHAYILESLCDLGHSGRAAVAMEQIAALQRDNGAVPGFANVRWVCSTGLFQYAIVWYKLGDIKRANAAFAYAAKLQNRSGGWYGSYGWFAKYFPKAEIAWAVKYFLDAFRLKLVTSFEEMAPIFSEQIEEDDGRYKLVYDTIAERAPCKILDAGCGKGRYLRRLAQSGLPLELHGADLSQSVMEGIPDPIITAQGSLLSLPYDDESFDVVYTCEALEHAVHLDAALRELARVLKPGGTLLIIDKDKSQLGRIQLPEWEQWFDVDALAKQIQRKGFSVEALRNIGYEGRHDGLFAAWMAIKG